MQAATAAAISAADTSSTKVSMVTSDIVAHGAAVAIAHGPFEVVVLRSKCVGHVNFALEYAGAKTAGTNATTTAATTNGMTASLQLYAVTLG